ncbi:putative integral membrane protein [Babesia bovis T2Bo]|uniref:Uncharacterized protein n=1 Tax=Babesia bovis TaxID=5865 RepID=A7AUN8_BABBO|nr:putative integral membrane protein [Babesia bovis T2Bo]EDO06649.1 putative integral membrane protein [Babesia bovis T2Bo]|eukprot:XP_001610217.1 hypothetical protein [Babesia bovis T2Bo]
MIKCEVGYFWRLLLYCFVCTFVGPFYDNWVSVEKWLYREGAYIDMCPDVPDTATFADTWYCADQQVKVSMLLPICRVAETSMSFLIGIFMDFVGPRTTAIVGIILRTIGWSLMSFAVRKPGGLIASFVLLGTTTNFIVFPCLTIGLYNRKYRHPAVLVIGMCSCFACMLMKLKLMILETGFFTAKQINLWYTILLIFPHLLVCILLLPSDVKALEREEVEQIVILDEVASVKEGEMSTLTSDSVVRRESQTMRFDETHQTEVVPVHTKDFTAWTLRGFAEVLLKKEVFVSLLYFAFNFSSITHVQQVYSLVHHDDWLLLELNEYMVPLAVIPCIIFAFLYMFMKPIYILIFMNTIGLFMHLSAMGDGRALGIFLSITLVITYSILNTQVYNYLDGMFHRAYLGSVVGALNGMCGLWMFIQMLAVQYKTSRYEIVVVSGILAAMRFLFLLPYVYFMVTTLLAIRRTKKLESIDAKV